MTGARRANVCSPPTGSSIIHCGASRLAVLSSSCSVWAEPRLITTPQSPAPSPAAPQRRASEPGGCPGVEPSVPAAFRLQRRNQRFRWADELIMAGMCGRVVSGWSNDGLTLRPRPKPSSNGVYRVMVSTRLKNAGPASRILVMAPRADQAAQAALPAVDIGRRMSQTSRRAVATRECRCSQ